MCSDYTFLIFCLSFACYLFFFFYHQLTQQKQTQKRVAKGITKNMCKIIQYSTNVIAENFSEYPAATLIAMALASVGLSRVVLWVLSYANMLADLFIKAPTNVSGSNLTNIIFFSY